MKIGDIINLLDLIAHVFFEVWKLVKQHKQK